MPYSFVQHRGNKLGASLLREWVRVSRATATVPASTTVSIYTISNGRVLVHLLLGEVTTIIQNQANNLSVIVNPTTGTSGTIATVLNIANDEVGTLYIVEGDGTALVGTDAGTGWGGAGLPHPFIVPIGTIDILTSATNTGAVRWDLWYEPLDFNATVVAA